MKLRILALFCMLTAVFLFPFNARADGIIIPQPPCLDCPPPPCPRLPCPPTPTPIVQLNIRYHHVTVTIQDQVVVTHVDQVFSNPNSYAVEGTYLFPLPPEAAVSSFTLWMDGQAVKGEVMDATQARQKYQEIVSQMRDPALLEYAGRGAVQAHIFPIPAGGERRIELEYSQALVVENGLLRYTYPLNTEKFSAKPLESVTVNVDVRTSQAIRAVYSPSQAVAVSRLDEHHVTAGYEASNVLPDTDFTLYVSLGDDQAFHLLTFRNPGEPDEDGFFLLLLAPRPDAAQQTLPKDVILVLDHSGSMEGEKFAQAQDALRYVLRHLNPEDRFGLIAFSTGVERYADSLRPAAEANQALNWVDRLGAQGSTDINRALLEAAGLADPERPTYLIFLTDGLPTIGVVDNQQILSNLDSVARKNLRLFAFGVGFDVDTYLLDSLSQGHHGASTYVKPGERLDEILSGFYTRISTPVLTDLALDFGSLSAYDLYPSPLPDLFSGSQIIVVGRYRLGGMTDVTLKGMVNGQEQSFSFTGQHFPAAGDALQPGEAAASNPLAAIPRLWATRKIGYLLNQVRLKGPDKETIDQIVRLSIRYGIVTPYTSYLVTEPMPLGASAQGAISNQAYEAARTATAPASGAQAVQKAADQGALAGAEQAPSGMGGGGGGGNPAAPGAAPSGEPGTVAQANPVRTVGARTFVLSDGKWMDTAFDPDKMKTIRVVFLSSDYFALVSARPDLAAAFALGEEVIALSDGVAYEVIPASGTAPAVTIPPTYTPQSQPASPTPVAVLPGENPPALQPSAAAPTAQPGSQPGACPLGAAVVSLVMLAAVVLVRSRR